MARRVSNDYMSSQTLSRVSILDRVRMKTIYGEYILQTWAAKKHHFDRAEDYFLLDRAKYSHIGDGTASRHSNEKIQLITVTQGPSCCQRLALRVPVVLLRP